MNLSDLYYNLPEAAYLVFLIFLFLALFWILFQHRQTVLSKYTVENKLDELLISQTPFNYWLRVFGLCLAWICLCLALMQPKGNARYPPELEQTRKQNVNTLRLQPHEVLFFIDVSASMSTLDGRVGQSRFENAKDIADQVMSHLQGQTGSLYSFTSTVSKLSPPSMDYLFMRLMLRNMQINEGGASGTDIKAALQYIHDNYLNPSTSLIKTVILISDGEDNRLELLQGSEREKYIQETIGLLGDPNSEKMHVYTIGVGTKKGGEIPQLTYEGKSVTSHLNEELLQALSSKGQGRYYAGSTYAAADIAMDLAKQIAQVDVFALTDLTTGVNPSEDLIYDLYYQIPLGLAIVLLALCFFWPETSMLKQKLLTQSVYYAMLLSLFFLPTWLAAEQNHEEQLRLAAAYYTTKNYSAAVNIYQSLLAEDLSGWERGIVTYNLGTALAAAQGMNEKAIESLQAIPVDNHTSPVLTFRLKKNLAVDNFSQAEKLSAALKPSSSEQDPFFKAIYFFKQALEEIPLAQDSKCNMLHIAGEESCSPESDLEEMVVLAKMGIASMRASARQNLVEQSSLQQGLPWLLTGLQLIGKDIAFMQDHSFGSSLQADYQKLFVEQASTWNPLWKALQEKLTDNEQEASLFLKANQAFDKMLSAFDQGDFKEAKAEVRASSKQLNRLMRRLFSKDPFQEVISRLLSNFSLASLQDPLESNTLLFLYQDLNEITPPKEHEVLNEGMDAIRDNLEHSLSATQKQQDVLAQIFFNEAWQQGKRIQLLLDPNLKDQPEMVLEAGIDEQRHSLAQTRLLSHLIERQEKLPETVVSMVVESQQYVLTFSEYFYDSAYTKQREEFSAEVPEGSKDTRCQYHPWHEVFPLFQQGVNTLEKTVKILKMSTDDFNVAMQNQESVLSVWSDALVKLKAPKNTESCHVTPLANEPGQKVPTESFEDIARLIEQMNAEDQKPKTSPELTKEGLRPW